MENKTVEKINGFIDAVQTMTPRGSFYNTKDDKVAALQKRHAEIKGMDEDLYKLFMFYPGINDYNRLNIVGSILQDKSMTNVTLPVQRLQVPLHRSFVGPLRDVSYPRVLKLFLELNKRKVNNKRLKRTALEFVLGDPKLVRRAVTYRVKMGDVLRHVWGVRTCGSIVDHINQSNWREPMKPFLKKEVFKYNKSALNRNIFVETVMFLLKADYDWTVPEYKAYDSAKDDIQAGLDAKLPYDTMMGFRNNHFTGFDLKVITEKGSETMTEKRKISVATKAAKKRNATVDVNYSNLDPTTVYREAYRAGEFTEKMLQGIDSKVSKLLRKFDIQLGKVRMIIDNSQSMAGVGDQENDAISRVLAIAKFFEKASTECKRFYTNETDNEEFPTTGGETSFAKLLIRAAKDDPDVILVLTDGYENAPEGLTDLVIKGLRHAGSNAKVIQINPTFAAEKGESRSISKDVPVLPVSDLSKLEGTFQKVLLDRNKAEGLRYYKKLLLAHAAPYLANQLPANVVAELKEVVSDRRIDLEALT